MNLLFLFIGIVVIVLIVGFQFKVCKKYLFDDAHTKIDVQNKTLTVKKQVIHFSNIQNISIREIELTIYERFLVSIIFFNGVMEMELLLKNGTKTFIRLPQNYIMDFCKKLEKNGVQVEY